MPAMNRLPILTAICLLAASSPTLRAGNNWPEYRGPSGNGQSDSKGLPTSWDEQTNVKWKAPIHDKGWSSPVIWGNQVWLTTASEEGQKMYVICLDRETGKVIFDNKIFELENPIDIRKY